MSAVEAGLKTRLYTTRSDTRMIRFGWTLVAELRVTRCEVWSLDRGGRHAAPEHTSPASPRQ